MSSKLASQPHAAELQLVVDAKLSEVVRSFARETALSEGVSVAISGSIASDMLRIWHALCALGAKHDRARIVVLCTKEDVAIRIFLEGHARFAGLVSHLVSLSDHDQTLSFKEHGINGWVVSLHRGIAEDQKLIVSTSPPSPPQTPGEEAG